MSKLSKEELEIRMAAQIQAIPTPNLSEKQRLAIKEKNREMDKKNLEHTVKILQERKLEALVDGDQKKKYACLAVERDQKDQYNVRSKIQELELQFNTAGKAIPEKDRNIFKLFSDLNDEKFWERAKTEGFSEQEIHLYYKDVWCIEPKVIVKYIEMMKIRQEIRRLEKLNK
jgi:hypothetical protein